MNEDIPDVKPGEPIWAVNENRVRRAITALDAEGPPTGMQQAKLAAVRGIANQRPGKMMVRITSHIVPQSSIWYPIAIENQTEGPLAFNAVMQVWDDQNLKWVDDPTHATYDAPYEAALNVIVMDDQQGWRPLTKGDIIAVEWHKDAGFWVPIHSREVAVVMTDGSPPDDEGFYSGWRVVYDSDQKQWVQKEEVYILDVA